MPLSQEELAQKEADRAARAAATEKEIADMDMIGSQFTEVALETPAAQTQAQLPADEVRDERVAEAGPEDTLEVKPETTPVATTPTEPVTPTTPVETPATPTAETTPSDGEYDFSFINEMAKAAIRAKRQETPVEQVPTQTPQTPQTPTQTTPRQPTKLEVPLPTDLATKEDMEAAFESPEKMLELMGKVYTKAVMAGAEIALQQLPNVMQPMLRQQQKVTEEAVKFYKENPELKDYGDFVQFVAMTVEDAHPDWDYSKVMAETATEAKKRLPMLKQAQTNAQREPTKPSFAKQGPGGTKTRPASPAQVSALEAEINAMPDIW